MLHRNPFFVINWRLQLDDVERLYQILCEHQETLTKLGQLVGASEAERKLYALEATFCQRLKHELESEVHALLKIDEPKPAKAFKKKLS